MSDYIANTENDIKEMLSAIGAKSIDALFADIKPHQRPASFDLPPGKSEFEVVRYFKKLSKKNISGLVCFLGCGYYDHEIPSIVDHLSSRSEFYTAYTPYQPECSQGTLQAIYEYQSALCRLTGLDIANASLYDGGTALYEAVMMARRITGRNRVVVDEAINPIYRTIIYSYTKNLNIEFVEIPIRNNSIDRAALKKELNDKTACVLLQNPNFFGHIDDHSDIASDAHHVGALVIESVYPVALGLLKTPAEMGADIVTGEGQSLGIPLGFGGPYLGFMTTKKNLARKMPGRIVGETLDVFLKRSFVLTLQAREQHIRREKATSNICSNEALCALRALIYLCALGKNGLIEVAKLNHEKSEFAKTLLTKIKGITIKQDCPTFNEFLVELPKDPAPVIGAMVDKGFAAGFPLNRYYHNLKNHMLVTVTEKRTKEEIIRYAESLESVLWS